MTPKKILRSYSEAARIILALVFLGIIVLYLTWAVRRVVDEMDRVANVKSEEGGVVGFDLKAAGQLDFRGLVKSAL